MRVNVALATEYSPFFPSFTLYRSLKIFPSQCVPRCRTPHRPLFVSLSLPSLSLSPLPLSFSLPLLPPSLFPSFHLSLSVPPSLALSLRHSHPLPFPISTFRQFHPKVPTSTSPILLIISTVKRHSLHSPQRSPPTARTIAPIKKELQETISSQDSKRTERSREILNQRWCTDYFFCCFHQISDELAEQRRPIEGAVIIANAAKTKLTCCGRSCKGWFNLVSGRDCCIGRCAWCLCVGLRQVEKFTEVVVKLYLTLTSACSLLWFHTKKNIFVEFLSTDDHHGRVVGTPNDAFGGGWGGGKSK